LLGPAGPAQAQDDAVCEGWAAEQALPFLNQSYALSAYAAIPNPQAWGPTVGPFTSGPAGAAALFGPPGLVAAYGPLGPGPTANNLSAIVLRPSNGAAAAPPPPPGGGQPGIIIGPSGPTSLPTQPQLGASGTSTMPPAGGDLGTQLALASLRQAELGNLIARYAASAGYQTAVAFWASSYATLAKETYAQALADCKDYMEAARAAQAR
jgi:hypothetical protein